ncbi:cytochrome P450 monooxygenase-like protein [Poronia punctata]|nr:cytochrome P450 monooxygenase-like protein [Poronia punctata]
MLDKLLTQSGGHTITLVVLVALISIIAVAVYRLRFHPLAGVPGPKLAGLTLLYQTWFCFVGGSRFYLKIAELHEKYGPIVRIGPNEIHLSDPSHLEEIYRVGTQYSKDPAFYGAFGNPNSSFTTASNELHRLRRSGLNAFFSQRMVLELEGIVHEKTELLLSRLQEALDSGAEIDMHHGFRAVSVDVVTDYAFGQCYDLLKQSDLGLRFFTLMHKIGPAAWIFRQWPWIKPITMSIPGPIVKHISEPISEVRAMQQHCHEQVMQVKANSEEKTINPDARPNIFSALMDPGKGFSKAVADHLEDEAYLVITAAADTTGNAMTYIARQVVENPHIYHRLHAELKHYFPDEQATLEYPSLQRLPYLTMVIKEGLRLAFGVAGRLPRVVPASGATFHGYTVPPETVVSMSPWTLHHNEEYFSNPTKFDPERWEKPEQAQYQERSFIPFGKGSRACVGINLAYSELYIVIGTLFRRFPNLVGNVLTAEDVAYDDYFSSYNPLHAKKFHIVSARK